MSSIVCKVCDRCGDACIQDEPLRIKDLPQLKVRIGFVDLCDDCTGMFFDWLNEDPSEVFGVNLSKRGDIDKPNHEAETDEDEDECLVPGPILYPLPTPATLFESGEVKEITIQPQMRVRLNRLAVPSHLAHKFVIESIIVTGISDENALVAPVTATVFIGVPAFPGWADAEHPITMRVRHVPQQETFLANFVCERLPELSEVEP